MGQAATKHAVVVAPSDGGLPDPLAGLRQLHADRAAAIAEIKRLTAASTRLEAEIKAEAALLTEMAALSEAETADMRAWADEGCVGDPPAGKNAARAALAIKLAKSKASGEAAKGAIEGINQELLQRDADRIAFERLIHQEALEVCRREHSATYDEYVNHVLVGRKMLASLLGLDRHLVEQGQHMQSVGNFDAARPFFIMAEQVRGVVKIDPGVDNGEVYEAAAGWTARVEEMRKGGVA